MRTQLADTKTGASLRPLSELACAVIQSQPRLGDVVFASRSGETPIVGYRKIRLRIAKLGDLPADITPHVLRHSFASLAADLGYNEPTIASLLGHKTHSITSRYVHSADAVLMAAADAVSNETLKLMASDQAQPRLRDQQRDRYVVRDELTIIRCFRPTRRGQQPETKCQRVLASADLNGRRGHDEEVRAMSRQVSANVRRWRLHWATQRVISGPHGSSMMGRSSRRCSRSCTSHPTETATRVRIAFAAACTEAALFSASPSASSAPDRDVGACRLPHIAMKQATRESASDPQTPHTSIAMLCSVDARGEIMPIDDNLDEALRTARRHLPMLPSLTVQGQPATVRSSA